MLSPLNLFPSLLYKSPVSHLTWLHCSPALPDIINLLQIILKSDGLLMWYATLIPSSSLRPRDPEVGRTEATVQFSRLSSLMSLRALTLATQIVPGVPGASESLLFLLLT